MVLSIIAHVISVCAAAWFILSLLEKKWKQAIVFGLTVWFQLLILGLVQKTNTAEKELRASISNLQHSATSAVRKVEITNYTMPTGGNGGYIVLQGGKADHIDYMRHELDAIAQDMEAKAAKIREVLQGKPE